MLGTRVEYRPAAPPLAATDYDVVDGDVDELYEEAYEAHHSESHCSREGDLLVLLKAARKLLNYTGHSSLRQPTFLSGLVHFLTSRIESLANFLAGSTTACTCSMFSGDGNGGSSGLSGRMRVRVRGIRRQEGASSRGYRMGLQTAFSQAEAVN